MGILQSVNRSGRRIRFDEDCHDRDEKYVFFFFFKNFKKTTEELNNNNTNREFLIESQGSAIYQSIPGPPSQVRLSTDIFSRRDEGAFACQYNGLVLSPSVRRSLLLFAFINKKKSFPMKESLFITSFINGGKSDNPGPIPFYSNVVKVVFYEVTVYKLHLLTTSTVTVKQAWSVYSNPSITVSKRKQEAIEVPLIAGTSTGLVHPQQLISSMQCWLDGWNRLHLEYDSLPLFITDNSASLLMVEQRQAFSLREAPNQPRKKSYTIQYDTVKR